MCGCDALHSFRGHRRTRTKDLVSSNINSNVLECFSITKVRLSAVKQLNTQWCNNGVLGSCVKHDCVQYVCMYKCVQYVYVCMYMICMYVCTLY